MKAMDKIAPGEFDDEDDDDDMDITSLGEFAYPLNADHFIRFKRRGAAMIISFEIESGNQPLESRMSRFADLAEDMNWSSLTLVSRGLTWFRAPEVIQFFDALVDGTLLDQFDDVLFYGQGAAGHAAMSFALTAPGSRVMALAPHFGFGIPGAPQDDRFQPPANIDFSARYAPTPDNLSVVKSALLLHDPADAADRAHAAALAAPTVTPLLCRHMGSRIEDGLSELGLLEELVVRALDGDLEETSFYRALRARRDNPAWLRRLIGRLIDADRPVLEALAVRNVAQRTGRHRFTKRFEQIKDELAAKGVSIPEKRG
ncbi:hypothetical protein [Oceaniovalibus sp. ACAM 378]|uniref:hypothetical protein n=1 Tax=Oceaniovalibus sp. ACAM 378 TaxID=2599923 RepID=UPI0011D3CA46|nr:hypothetical protein [Oceaniovalibus sp. ACAM 378]TYB91166.1 hypothetical protein FQ320_01315 [Oceaniovalibus sp. ACAM 378]